MPCEHNKDALIEAAASGAPLSGELRARLAECSSCREAFAQEQSLFAAIDAGLHERANVEVPPSLLPRVRAAIETLPAAHSHWSFGWMTLAGASLVVATLVVAVFFRPNRVTIPPVDSAANHSASLGIARPPHSPSVSAPSPRPGAIPRLPLRATRGFVPPVQASGAQSIPEVLVPHDDEIVLAGYLRQWGSRKRAPLVAGNADPTAVALLDVSPIQIAELDVKPLAEGNSQ